MSAPFEERSGVVPCGTPWGRWYQTLEEVFIEVQVPPGTRAKDICCNLQSQHIALSVRGQNVLQAIGKKKKPTNSLGSPSLCCAGGACGCCRTPVTRVSSSFSFQPGTSSSSQHGARTSWHRSSTLPLTFS
uniref:NudC domain containing 2 n=1 Tax=Amazona collaria TaxID=241587 RepID=A0A8B9IUJ7_9PSIT